MAQSVTIAKRDKRNCLTLPDEFVPKTRRVSVATAALEKKLQEAKKARESDCPPDFFTEPLDD
jgi:hypothetical protein